VSNKKPMTLNRETIKQLDDAALGGVAGGWRLTPISKGCTKRCVKPIKSIVEHKLTKVCHSGTFKTTCW
jgi:hypothetical protein